MLRSRTVLELLLLSFLAAGTALAADAPLKWTRIGPWAERARAIAVDPADPKNVYLGGFDGLFKSTDAGESWKAASKGLGDIEVRAVVIDPLNPKNVYVGGYRGGIFKSVDGGATWKAGAEAGGYNTLKSVPLHALAIDPVNPKRLIGSSIFRSTDGGLKWADFRAEEYMCGLRDVYSVAFDPRSPKTVYGAGVGELCKSTNGGASFTKVDVGIESPTGGIVVVVSPLDGAVYVGFRRNGLEKSTDGGKTWSEASGLVENPAVLAIALHPKDPKIVYVVATVERDAASVFKSTDGGANFQDVGAEVLPYSELEAIAIDPKNPETLYVGAHFAGAYKTTDGGGTWKEINRGFPDSPRVIQGLAVVSGTPRRIYASDYYGVHRTTNDGKSWEHLALGDRRVDIETLAAAGDVVVGGAEHGRIQRSKDRGDSWRQSSSGPSVRCLVQDPKDPNTVYACPSDGGIYRSVDGGINWRRHGTDDFNRNCNSFAMDPTSSQNLLAATRGSGVWRSTNGGKKWKEGNKGITIEKESFGSFGKFRTFLKLVVDPANPKTVFGASEDDGVYKSTDFGESWSSSGLTGEKLTTFAIDPVNGKRLVAGTKEKGVLLSTDGGASWSAANAGLPKDVENEERTAAVTALVIEGGKIYAGTHGQGLYVAE